MRRDFSHFRCLDCFENTHTIGEYYMVNNDLWLKATGDLNSGMLCIGCLELRLGRTLTPEDFSDCPLNQMEDSRRSERLSKRLKGEL